MADPTPTPSTSTFSKKTADQDISWLAARLQEPSTYAGLGLLATALGIGISPDLMHNITGIGIGIGGVLAFVISEAGS